MPLSDSTDHSETDRMATARPALTMFPSLRLSGRRGYPTRGNGQQVPEPGQFTKVPIYSGSDSLERAAVCVQIQNSFLGGGDMNKGKEKTSTIWAPNQEIPGLSSGMTWGHVQYLAETYCSLRQTMFPYILLLFF